MSAKADRVAWDCPNCDKTLKVFRNAESVDCPNCWRPMLRVEYDADMFDDGMPRECCYHAYRSRKRFNKHVQDKHGPRSGKP